jgi:hypothetical protein
MLEAVRSPRRATITISQSATGTNTDICVECPGESARRWSLVIAPHAVSERDIRPIRKFVNRPARRWPAALLLIPQFLTATVMSCFRRHRKREKEPQPC